MGWGDTDKRSQPLRMKPLPKPEYLLMNELIERLQLEGRHELFAVSLRLTYQVLHMRNAVVGNGTEYVRQIVEELHRFSHQERVYSFEERKELV